MVEIFIPFNDWSIDKLQRGIKTATTRSKPYGKPGDTFEVNIGTDVHKRYELVSVTQRLLGTVAKRHYDEEGAESTSEFIEVWNDIHPRRKFQPNDIKWFHKFKEV